jgi:hypothetical protein
VQDKEIDMQFRTLVRLEGKTATGLEVPPAVVEALGAGKRAKVVVTINGYSYRSSVAPYSGVYMLPLAAEHRDAAGVAAGETIDVDLVVDTEVRAVVAPADLAAALDADAAARKAFDALSYSNQRRHVLSIEDAKTPETRARRVAKVLERLIG